MGAVSTNTSLGAKLAAGLEGAAVAVPLTLGSGFVLYTNVAPEWGAYGMFAGCVALVLLHLLTARDTRPVAYSARFFEAVLLATMVGTLSHSFAEWGLEDSSINRMAVLILLSSLAALCVGLCWLFRIQRFVRFIPAPVFAGYVNSAALAVLLSQSKALVEQMHNASAPVWVLVVAVGSFGCSWLVKKFRPDWPAAAVGLAVGVMAALVLNAFGVQMAMLSHSVTWLLPVGVVELGPVLDALLHQPRMLLSVFAYGGGLGLLMFLNTVVTQTIIGQMDNRFDQRPRDKVMQTVALLVSGVIGAPPMSGTSNVAKAMLRKSPLSAASLCLLSVCVGVTFLSGAFAWLPFAALIGAFLFDAMLLLDKEYFTHLWQWVRRQKLAMHKVEDLLLVSAVMVAYMTVNIAAAMFTGLLLGLLLHAYRNTRNAVRHYSDGQHMRSNCARSAGEYELLKAEGERIRIFQLDSNQFFASADALQESIRSRLEGASIVVLDWSTVQIIDSSIGLAIARLELLMHEDGIRMVHAVNQWRSPQVLDVLKEHLHEAQYFDDLDWALEHAENLLLQEREGGGEPPAAMALEDTALLASLSPDDREAVMSRMQTRDYTEGEMIVRYGEDSDAILVMLSGNASVLLPRSEGGTFRIAGIRGGSTIGEIGFLDRAVRSGSVVAETPVRVSSLSRKDFDELSNLRPQAVQRMLVNISLDLASRMRHTNAQASIRG